MIKGGLEKKELDDVYGLSCLENYTTYALKKEKINYTLLYYKRWLPLCQIIEEFLDAKVRFAEFYKVRRLQKVAEELGLIKTLEDDKYLMDINEDWDNYDYWTVKVTEEFVKKRYSTQLLRSDHYILLSYKNENEFYYLNDTPRDEGSIDYKSLTEIIGKKVYAFSIVQDVKIEKKQLKETFFNSIIEDNLKIKECPWLNINIATLRDILGILKIIRKQAVLFCENFIDTKELWTCLRDLDNYYALIEYMRLRNRFSNQKIKEICDQIIYKDKEIKKLIISKMNCDKL